MGYFGVPRQLHLMFVHHQENHKAAPAVKSSMRNTYSILPEGREDDHRQDDFRLLKKLKVALIFWMVSFLMVVFWYTSSIL